MSKAKRKANIAKANIANIKPTILVTGGAGYIGSATVHSLINQGYDVIVIDNLSKGLKRLVHKKVKFYKADLADKNTVEKVFKDNKNKRLRKE